MIVNNSNTLMLSKAQAHADAHSTCEKVQVGSLIITENFELIYGSNHGVGKSCREDICNRIKLYGENSKLHRLPSDCLAIHSEIDAICQAAKIGLTLKGSVAYVTRYPCEGCARALISAGVRKVVYGREESISKMTESMFMHAGVQVIHENEWTYADNNN